MNIDIKKASNFIFNEVDIIQYTTDVMGFSYKRYGKNLRTVCPLHEDTDPSFTITEGKQVWHCFGCKQGGSLISLVEKFHNLNRIQAITKILDDLIIDKSRFQDSTGEIIESEILVAAQQYFVKEAKKSKTFKDYFLKKGYVKEDLIKILKIGVGYSSDKESLIKFLIEHKFDENEIWEYDLNSDRFTNSIVFPVYNQYGYISHFKCRLFSGDIKSMNSNIDIPTYSEKAFWGIHALKNKKYVVLVEGESDWLALHLKGFNALGMGGLKINEELLDTIQSYEITDIYIWTDGDQAGWNFLQLLLKDYGKLFCSRKLNGKVIFVDHSDPDEIVLSGFNVDEAMRISEIIPVFVLERRYVDVESDYRKSYEMINSAIRMVKGYDNITIEYLIQYLFHRTGFSIESIRDRFIDQNDAILYDYRAEQYLITYLLDHHDSIVQYGIAEDWFISNASKIIFRLIRDKEVNSITIGSVIPLWINDYLEQMPIINEDSVQDYIKVVKDLYRRRLISDVVKGVLRKNTDFHESLNYLNESMISLYKKNDNNLVSMVDSAKRIVDNIVNKVPIETMKLGEEAWSITNRVLHGIRPKKLIFVMGNTGHGKTNLVLNWIYWLSIRQKYKGLIFSGEMDSDELTERLLAIATGISANHINVNNVGGKELDKIFTIIKKIQGDTLYIHDTMDFDYVFNMIRYAVIKHNIQYVIFDYLQLMSPSNSIKGMNRTQQLKEFTRKMKVEVCGDLGLAAIVTGQLSDQGLDDATPQGRRSSESKLIQADGDVIIAIRKKNAKEMELEPIGNVIYHIDKVRYNRSNTLLYLQASDINLSMKEIPYEEVKKGKNFMEDKDV